MDVRVERLCAAAAAAAAADGNDDDGGGDAASEASSVGMSVSHTSHVTRHTSHVTRHTSHVKRHTSHVTPHTPQVGSASAKSWTTWGTHASKKSQVACYRHDDGGFCVAFVIPAIFQKTKLRKIREGHPLEEVNC